MRAGGFQAAFGLLICLISAPALAQEYRWSSRIGEEPPFASIMTRPFPATPLGDDPPDGTTEEVRDLVVAPDGDFYVVGVFGGQTDFDFGPGQFQMTPVGGEDSFIMRLGPDGTLRWARQIGGDSTGAVLGVGLDVNGGYLYVVGNFQGKIDFDPGPGKKEQTSNAGAGYLLRLDLDANFSWVRLFPLSKPRDAVTDTAGNVYAFGSFVGPTDFDPGSGTTELTSFGGEDAFVVKLTSAGSFVWVARQGGPLEDATWRVGIDAAGQVYTAGYFAGTADFDPGPGTLPLTAAGSGDQGRDIGLSKLTAAGGLVWAEKIGNAGLDHVGGFALDASARIHLSGSFRGTVDFDPGPGEYLLSTGTSVNGSADAFVLQLDSDGALRWAVSLRGYSPLYGDSSTALTLDDAGYLYVTGSFHPAADFDPGPGQFFLQGGQGFAAGYVWKLDDTGELVWAGGLYGEFLVYVPAIGVDDAGRIVVGGQYQGEADMDPGLSYALLPWSFTDGFLLSLGPFGEIPTAVPDGDATPGVPLTVSREGNSVVLDWGAACGGSQYSVYYGNLLALPIEGYNHDPLLCLTDETHLVVTKPGDLYFLVVPNTGAIEGSYGHDSDGAERPASPFACLPQLIGACPP